MKRIMVFLTALALLSVFSDIAFALDKEELKRMIKDLSVEDMSVVEGEMMDRHLKSAEATGYMESQMPGPSIGSGGAFNIYMPANVSANMPAGTGLSNVSQMYGGGGGPTINIDKNWGWGLSSVGMKGVSQKTIGANSYDYNVGATYYMLYGTYKPIITPQWIVDMNLGAGYMVGDYKYTVLNTTTLVTSQSIARSGSTIPVMIEMEARYRLHPIMFVGVKGGYLFASINELKAGDIVDTAQKPLDFSGGYIALTIGGNF